MATNADRVLKILLKLEQDTDAATAKAVGNLKRVEAQAERTAAAGNRAPGSSVAFDRTALAKQNIDHAKRLNSLDAEGIANAEMQALKQALIAIQMERRVIMETQLEAAEARIAGNPAMAVKLEREAAIRTKAMGIQRALNVSTEQAIVLAERMVIAEEKINASKTRGLTTTRATVAAMAEQAATGNLTASGVGRSFAGISSALSIAALGGYTLYEVIKGQVTETRELNREYDKIVEALQAAVKEWDTMASRAETFADKVKLADKIKQDLDKMSREMAAFRTKELPLWQRFWDDLKTGRDNAFDTHGVLAKPGSGGPGPFEDERRRREQEATARAAREANEELNKANQATAGWAAAQADVTSGLTEYGTQLEEAEAKLAELNAARQVNPSDIEAVNAYIEQQVVVDDLRGKIEQLWATWRKNDADERKTKEQAVNDALRDQKALMEDIRGARSVVENDPFDLTADQRAKLIPILQQEAQALREAGDEWAALRVEQELATLTFAGEFQAEIVSWLNGMGTAAQKAADLLSGTLNNAIKEVSGSLAEALWKTGEWEINWVSLGQTATQMMIEMGIQQGIQFLAGEARKLASTQSTVTQSATVTAAATPAAVAESGATGGFNWVAAGIAAAAAIALIVGLLAFHGGGVVGRDRGNNRRGRRGPLREDEELAVLEHGEVVLSREQLSGSAKLTGLQRKALAGSAADSSGFMPDPFGGGLDPLPGTTGTSTPTPTPPPSSSIEPDLPVRGGPSVEIGRGGSAVSLGGPSVEIGRGGSGADLIYNWGGYVNGVPMQVNPLTGEMIPILRAQPSGGIWASGGDLTMAPHVANPSVPSLGDLNWASAGGGSGSMASWGSRPRGSGSGPGDFSLMQSGHGGGGVDVMRPRPSDTPQSQEFRGHWETGELPRSAAELARLRFPVGPSSTSVFAEHMGGSRVSSRGDWSESSSERGGDKIVVNIYDDLGTAMRRHQETPEQRKHFMQGVRRAR